MSKRDNKRLELIRSLPCVQCGAGPRSQAAHSNFGEHNKGMGIKADDRYTIPLCVVCHQNFDQNLWQKTRQEQYDWFMGRLEFINAVLANKDEDNAIF